MQCIGFVDERDKPALMILCLGGNDLLRRLDQKETADNLRSMVRMAREHGVAVVLVSVPTPGLILSPPSFYREIALEFRIPLEGKTLSSILGERALKADYIHPNGAGYRVFAGAAVTGAAEVAGGLDMQDVAATARGAADCHDVTAAAGYRRRPPRR